MILTDFKQSPHKIIVDLINYDNGCTLVPDELLFGIPKEVNNTHNTEVVITAKPGTYHTGSATITYNRVDLATIPGTRSTTFALSNAVKVADLIGAINAAYQLNLVAEDFLNDDLPEFDPLDLSLTKGFTLRAGPVSLVFRGSVDLIIHRDAIQLSSIITVTELNGLVYVQPNP